MGPLAQLKYRFEQFSIAEKIIVINVFCFVISTRDVSVTLVT